MHVKNNLFSNELLCFSKKYGPDLYHHGCRSYVLVIEIPLMISLTKLLVFENYAKLFMVCARAFYKLSACTLLVLSSLSFRPQNGKE